MAILPFHRAPAASRRRAMPGMVRQVAIDHARVGAQTTWAGTVAIAPDAETGVHHHGTLESAIFGVRGRARMRWGERLAVVAEAEPGDVVFVAPLRAPSGDRRRPRPEARMRAGALRHRGRGGEHHRRRAGGAGRRLG